MDSSPHRIRVCFSKDGDLRFIGHLDLQRIFERALRRSDLPLRYSQGFNPKVHLSLASALPLGFSSGCELLDFWLDQPVDKEVIQDKLTISLPADLKVLEVNEVPNQLPSLQASLCASEYLINFPESTDTIHFRSELENLLDLPAIPYDRKRKQVDLKPMIESIRWEDQLAGGNLHIRMTAIPQANGRPDELLQILGLDPSVCKIHRTRLYFTQTEEE